MFTELNSFATMETAGKVTWINWCELLNSMVQCHSGHLWFQKLHWKKQLKASDFLPGFFWTSTFECQKPWQMIGNKPWDDLTKLG